MLRLCELPSSVILDCKKLGYKSIYYTNLCIIKPFTFHLLFLWWTSKRKVMILRVTGIPQNRKNFLKRWKILTETWNGLNEK